MAPEFMGSDLNNLRVVLVRTRNPLNIGAAARAMSNFGVLHLRVVNPYPVAFQEARSAVGAAHVLARAEQYDCLADAIADCALVVGTTSVGHRELQHPLRRLEPGARLIRRQMATAPVALLFGSEKVGLSNQDIAHCHWLVRIPTREVHGSMNLAQAVGVCLYELIRDNRSVPRKERTRRARAGELERITESLIDVLVSSEYIKPSSRTAKEDKLRRFVRRLNLEEQDAELLLGMLRQIGWKMDRTSG